MRPSFQFFIFLVISAAFLVISNIRLLGDVTQKKYFDAHHGLLDDYAASIDEEMKEYNRTIQFGLNRHVWLVKALSIDFLCNIPLFPKAPNKRLLIDQLELSQSQNPIYAQRIFGFLKPPTTGRYILAISSDASSELWLSSNEKIENVKLIAHVGEKNETRCTKTNSFLAVPSQISRKVELTLGKLYFIDVLHVGLGQKNQVSVKWILPGNSNFSSIDKEFLKPYIPNDLDFQSGIYDWYIPSVNSCKGIVKQNPFLKERYIHYAKHEQFASVLPTCNAKGLSQLHAARNLTLNKYESLTNRKYYKQTTIYPHKLVNAIAKDPGRMSYPIWGDNTLDKEDATKVIRMYLGELKKRINRKYTLQSIIGVKKTEIFQNESRYLLDLELTSPAGKKIYLSEYVYYYNNTLCYTNQWERNTLITFVVTVKNQGKWIHYFLDNIATIIAETNDHNINIVIFDYESSDVDVDDAVNSRGLQEKTKIMKKKGRYSRRESFNRAVSLITDSHSIVFLLDLHLTIGEGFLNDIRKHTVEGHLVYTPIIVRQWSDTTPHHNNSAGYYGFYETYGFGLIGIFKSDWDRIGGFATPVKQNDTYKWGGEDYELMDQVCRQGLEYYRIKCPYVYHFSHSKTGMWDE